MDLFNLKIYAAWEVLFVVFLSQYHSLKKTSF